MQRNKSVSVKLTYIGELFRFGLNFLMHVGIDPA